MCSVYFILMKPCFTQHLEFLSCLVRSLASRHGDKGVSRLLHSWDHVADAGSDPANFADLFFGVSPEWVVLQVVHWKSQFAW